MNRCQVVEIRNSADVVGLACLKTASRQCSDCGSELCESHTEICSGCRSIFCPSCFLFSSSTALEARSRGTSRAKKSLEFAYPEIAFRSGCLFNFISFICSSVIGTVSGDCHDSPPIEVIFRMGEISRAGNVGTE
jgi:hypothetical protein